MCKGGMTRALNASTDCVTVHCLAMTRYAGICGCCKDLDLLLHIVRVMLFFEVVGGVINSISSQLRTTAT